MKKVAWCIMGLFFLFVGVGCERVDKAVETYKEVKEDAKEKAGKVEQDVKKGIEKKARAVLGMEQQKTGEGQEEQETEDGKEEQDEE